MLPLNKKLSEDELLIVQEGVDIIYDDFISKVGEGRNMSKAMVDSIGQGRDWAGSDAIEIGLVDEYGGINDAIDYAAEMAGISEEDIALQFYPKKKKNDLFEFLENIEEMDNQTSIQQTSQLELQLREMYGYAQSISTQNKYQARLPFLMWIK